MHRAHVVFAISKLISWLLTKTQSPAPCHRPLQRVRHRRRRSELQPETFARARAFLSVE